MAEESTRTRFQRAWDGWLADQEALAPEEDGLLHPDLAFVGGWTAHTDYIRPHIEALEEALREASNHMEAYGRGVELPGFWEAIRRYRVGLTGREIPSE